MKQLMQVLSRIMYYFSTAEVRNYHKFKATQIYYFRLLEVRSLKRAGSMAFLLEAPQENTFSCLFLLLEALAFLGSWPHSLSSKPAAEHYQISFLSDLASVVTYPSLNLTLCLPLTITLMITFGPPG